MSQVVIDGKPHAIPRAQYIAFCEEAAKKKVPVEEVARKALAPARKPTKKAAAKKS
jgi:hypothetical protein